MFHLSLNEPYVPQSQKLIKDCCQQKLLHMPLLVLPTLVTKLCLSFWNHIHEICCCCFEKVHQHSQDQRVGSGKGGCF